MSQPLISRNPDLLRLQEEGYDVAIVAGHLVLRNVPYSMTCGSMPAFWIIASVLRDVPHSGL